MEPLVLASTSPYRRELLARLQIPFVTAAPEIDETPHPHEAPDRLALRLSREKAQAVSSRFPDRLIVGADQVALLGGRLLSKPKGHEEALKQLQTASGKFMQFYTGVALLNARTGRCLADVVPCRVYFRHLTPEELEAYLEREKPYDCLGAFRAEGLGIALFRRIETEDPTALVGLPLIKLVSFLRRFRVALFKPERTTL